MIVHDDECAAFCRGALTTNCMDSMANQIQTLALILLCGWASLSSALEPEPSNRGDVEASTHPKQQGVTDLETIMRSMATTPGVIATFVETKRLALLDAPLETRGTLYFIPPNRLARHTSHPGPSVLIIDNDRLVFDDQAGGDRINLDSNPVARAFVDSFIVLFNGDLETLRENYNTRFESNDGGWRLHLTPRNPPLNSLISSISLQGDVQRAMREMTMTEENGDTTHTIFSEVDPSHHFNAGEIERYFRRKQQESP